jgi:phosphatidate phosphatase APP1
MPAKFTSVKNKILACLRISHLPMVKVYIGYGNQDEILVYGHVLSMAPLPRKKYTDTFLVNLFSLIRLFIVRPKAHAVVRLDFNGEVHETQTEKDGFYKFEWKPLNPVSAGWHTVQVSYISTRNNNLVLAKSEGSVFIPHDYQYAFISDIDDTFLISHSSKMRKRLYVLFTENAQSRKPFDGVVNHYQLLAKAGATSNIPNPFFYVSSSEWNLYDYIKEFCRNNEMPQGVFLLSQIKRLKDFLKTGQGNHSEKYVRIVRILKAFPHQKYILLGDDSQQDPEIYAALVRDFPGKIFAVYLRRIYLKNEAATNNAVSYIEKAGVYCCYFKHSAEAIEHSVSIGLIEKT